MYYTTHALLHIWEHNYEPTEAKFSGGTVTRCQGSKILRLHAMLLRLQAMLKERGRQASKYIQYCRNALQNTCIRMYLGAQLRTD